MMNSILIAFVFIAVFGVMFLVALALAIYAVVKLSQVGKRLDALEAEVRAGRGAPPMQ